MLLWIYEYEKLQASTTHLIPKTDARCSEPQVFVRSGLNQVVKITQLTNRTTTPTYTYIMTTSAMRLVTT
jgi:hypothetical protein